jgi:RHS repeat-associated protein
VNVYSRRRALHKGRPTGLASSQTSSYAYTTTAENFITAVTETSDQSIPTPAAGQQTATYNNLNQLTALSGHTLSWDADGNLVADGSRTYSWDAENRLVAIAYPGQPGKQTTFAYDGQGRRVSMTSTPQGGGQAVTTSYVWCGLKPCQARSSGSVARGYYAEGEMTTGGAVYYGIDQLGSVRRAFASTTNAPAYAYDPYGAPLQATAPLTDFSYAGMMVNADSGLYLTPYRAYDPAVGPWLSRDPIGEAGGINLYAYVNGDPISNIDPTGECPWCIAVGVGAATGAGLDVVGQLARNGGRLDCVDWGQVGLSALAGGALGGVGRFATMSARSLGANPFKGKTAKEVAGMLGKKGYIPRGPDPAAGR